MEAKTEYKMDGFLFSVWGYEKSMFPIGFETNMSWMKKGIRLGFELIILTDEYWDELVRDGDIDDIPIDQFYDTYMKRLSCGQPITLVSESMFKVAIEKAMPFALYATIRHYAKYQYGNYWHICNMRPLSYDIKTIVKSFYDTAHAWRSAARNFYKEGEDIELVKFCTLQALNTLKTGVQLILSNNINPYAPYITSSWKEIWENKNLDEWTKINSTLYSDMRMWNNVLERFGVEMKEAQVAELDEDTRKEFNDKCSDLHEILMKTCIDYCRKNNLIIVDDIYFSADGLKESIEYGEWTPCTDSALTLTDDKRNRLAISM